MTGNAPIALQMDPEEIQKLHEAAVELYVSGRYAEARSAWEAVLASDPQDERALEGVRMVRVLAGEWPADAPGSAPHPAGPIEDELGRIEGLLADARYGDALLAAQRATEAERDHAPARRLAARALELYEAAPYIDVELTKAKQAVAEGREAEALDACQKILSLDPGHRAAAELLERMGGDGSPETAPAAPPARSAAAAPSPRPVSPPSTPPRSAAPPPTRSAVPLSPSPLQAPAADALFDLTDDDIAMEPSGVSPLGAPHGSHEPPRSETGAGRHENAVFGTGVDATDGERERNAISGFKEAAGSASHSLFEMPDEDVASIETSFSELEAEIDETQGPSEGEVDFDLPAGEAAPAMTAPATNAAPAPSDPADFSFTEEDFGFETTAEASSGAGLSPEARIGSLLEDSRRALRNGRYSEAIEAAARAFAIDPDAQGAQQLIDEARTKQDEADRMAEEALYTGRDKLTAGDLAAAEESFRAVLKIHPSHREALDGLDQVTRKRNEAEIRGGAPKAAPMKAETAAQPAIPESDWPFEPLTPKTSGPKPAAAAHPARPMPAPSYTPVPRKKAGGLGRRLVVLVGIIGVLGLLVGGGLFAFNVLLGGRTRPVEKALVVPRRERREAVKVDKTPPPPSPTEKPQPGPADAAAGVPRTLPEARRLVSQGKLEAARVVLADMVREAPDNIPAVDALKSVQQQIVERDKAAESMEQIKRSFKQERYEDTLRMLYRLPAGMQQGEVEVYKQNAWYNNGINYLLGGNTVEAVHCFDEALGVNPHDQQAQRLRSYAKTYSDREKDSAYLSFVDQLEKRPIDAK